MKKAYPRTLIEFNGTSVFSVRKGRNILGKSGKIISR
jgi:hypothetical protein